MFLPIAGTVAMLSRLDNEMAGDVLIALTTTQYSCNFYKSWVPQHSPYGGRQEKIFDRPTINGGRGSFPSKHSSMSFCGAGLVQKAYGFKVAIPFYALASVVGASRVYLDKHYVHDVIAGAMMGAKIALSSGSWFESLMWVPTPIQDGGVVSYSFLF